MKYIGIMVASGLLCAIHEFNCTTLEQAQNYKTITQILNFYNIYKNYSNYFTNMSFIDALV